MQKLMFKEIWATAGKKRLHWSKDHTMIVYDGNSIRLEDIKDMALSVLTKLGRLLDSEVLFGIPLSELKYEKPDLLKLRDIMGESGNRYSLWRDTLNKPLHDMKHNLATAIITHETACRLVLYYSASGRYPKLD
ncbi:hypothetical protein FRC06_008507 [Ceratobasidium sp. 370]|nr:hypothetical protein FRC06_008507 [Ceratobasidium sp. 370]